jgi:uncharacterized protein DUF2877
MSASREAVAGARPSRDSVIRAVTVGWKARDALARTGGWARVVACLSKSVYLDAAGEMLWLGPIGSALHSRAVLAALDSAVLPALDSLTALDSDDAHGGPPRASLASRARAFVDDTRAEILIDIESAGGWHPEPAQRTDGKAMSVAAAELRHSVWRIGRPRGLGVWLLPAHLGNSLASEHGMSLDEPFITRAMPHAVALADACVRDDPARAAEAAIALLGLGPGLTPSGDDYAGAAFFARARRAAGRGVDLDPWRAAADAVIERASRLTHPISAVLLRDLVRGEGHAPLHDLADALERGALDVAVAAARRLVGIGHSSGWDMLAGFSAGAGAGRSVPGLAGIRGATSGTEIQ